MTPERTVITLVFMFQHISGEMTIKFWKEGFKPFLQYSDYTPIFLVNLEMIAKMINSLLAI